jgi:hypothetical protein
MSLSGFGGRCRTLVRRLVRDRLFREMLHWAMRKRFGTGAREIRLVGGKDPKQSVLRKRITRRSLHRRSLGVAETEGLRPACAL